MKLTIDIIAIAAMCLCMAILASMALRAAIQLGLEVECGMVKSIACVELMK